MASPTFNFQQAVSSFTTKQKSLSEVTNLLLAQLSPSEKLSLLDGDTQFFPGMHKMLTQGYSRVLYTSGSLPHLGIPGLRFTDGPRGIVYGSATCFPVSMARGATWDVSLEEKVGNAIGLEARALGANFFGGVCINLPRHPAWGRIQETYGEDPILLGEFGAAITRGVQKNAMAIVKHFALNSMENARFEVDVQVEEEILHEVYLPHFRRVIEEDVAAVMSSYNSVNGEWAGQNEELLDAILRKKWGFEGVVVSDFIWGLRDSALSLRNGLDIEEPFAQQRALYLPAALEKGNVANWEYVDRAAKRILGTQIKHYATKNPEEPKEDVVFCNAHRKLAREVAARSMVLLQNEEVDGTKVLPLDASKLSSIALIGRLADKENTGDNGSSSVKYCPEVVTPFQGLKSALPNTTINLITNDDAHAAAKAASTSDVAILVVGYTADDEGEYVDFAAMNDPAITKLYPPPDGSIESDHFSAVLKNSGNKKSTSNSLGEAGAIGGDRSSLHLHPIDVDIIEATASANPRTIVCLVTAGAVIMEEWRHKVPGLLISWYSGTQGGNALADVLLGNIDASGRLPYSIPKDEKHLPIFEREAEKVRYERWHGQWLLDRLGVEAAFPLGFGLSYTVFETSEIDVNPDLESDKLSVSVLVANVGKREGRYIVQIYGKPYNTGNTGKDFPSRLLLGFKPVDLLPGEERRVQVSASIRPLLRWSKGEFVLACDTAIIEAGAYAGDYDVCSVHLDLRSGWA